MLDETYLMTIARVAVFTMMLLNGITIPATDLVSFRQPSGLLMRALFAVLVLVPLVVFGILMLFDLPVALASGLALLAAAPGAPMTAKRAQLAAGNIPFAANLQLKLVLAAIWFTPLSLALFKACFPLLPNLASSPMNVFREVAMVSLLPVGVGLLVQRLLPRVAERIGKPLALTSNLLFLLLLALIAWPALRMVVPLGWMASLAILVMATAALAVGHALGFGAALNQRASIATACIARNLGLAVVVASSDGLLAEVMPTLVAYLLLGMAAAVPYAAWMRRRR
jgi:BASS family bile acid:Na+ symporter